eukprot:4562052-Heterocapsa_arctica.AAC.1
MPEDAQLHELSRGQRVDADVATLRRRIMAREPSRRLGQVVLEEVIVRVTRRAEPRGQGKRRRKR